MDVGCLIDKIGSDLIDCKPNNPGSLAPAKKDKGKTKRVQNNNRHDKALLLIAGGGTCECKHGVLLCALHHDLRGL